MNRLAVLDIPLCIESGAADLSRTLTPPSGATVDFTTCAPAVVTQKASTYITAHNTLATNEMIYIMSDHMNKSERSTSNAHISSSVVLP